MDNWRGKVLELHYKILLTIMSPESEGSSLNAFTESFMALVYQKSLLRAGHCFRVSHQYVFLLLVH